MRVVLYLRMSRDEQERSIGEQRAALRLYAKKQGYKIVAEYVDEGISGDATEKRLAFQRMISDCSSKRFEVVLAWDQDRFGRFDPLEAGFWIKPMRDAGVVLETIAQGRVDWNDFAGRIVWSVTQEAKHAFLRDLARNALRGNIARAKEGKSVGKPPYGYDRDKDGRYILGEPEKIAAVRTIFDLRLLRLGYQAIANRLNEERAPTPTGAPRWSKESVKLILSRESYTGTLVFGRKHKGKYQTARNGIVSSDTAVGQLNLNPVKAVDAHPAIITSEQWNAVRQILADRPKPHAKNGRPGAALAGLLFCGLCGSRMYSQSLSGRAKTKNYVCSTYFLGKGCGYCRVPQDWMHGIVAETIRRRLLIGSQSQLAKRVQGLLNASPEGADTAIIESRLAKLDQQIDEASTRILTVNSRLVTTLESKLLEMQDRRNELARELAKASVPTAVSADDMAKKLWILKDIFADGDPMIIRAALQLCFQKIIVHFELGEKGKRGQGYKYIGGEIIGHSSKQWASLWSATPLCRSGKIPLVA